MSTPHGSYLMPSLEHATVADAMHPGILTTNPDTPLTEVARMMATHHVHSLAVMGLGDNGSGLGWGLVTDLDVLRASVDQGAEPTAAKLAVRPVVTVETTTPLREAAQRMIDRQTSHLLVVDPSSKRPIGVISTLDIAGIVAWGEG